VYETECSLLNEQTECRVVNQLLMNNKQMSNLFMFVLVLIETNFFESYIPILFFILFIYLILYKINCVPKLYTIRKSAH
jgi:hypothetical protein